MHNPTTTFNTPALQESSIQLDTTAQQDQKKIFEFHAPSRPNLPQPGRLFRLKNEGTGTLGYAAGMLPPPWSRQLQAQRPCGLDTGEETGPQSSCVLTMQLFDPVVRASPYGSPPSWPETTPEHGVGRAVGGEEGQQIFMTRSDTPITIQVDDSQASQNAKMKRETGAQAVRKHRSEKRVSQENELARLRNQNHALKYENQKLKEQLAICQHEHRPELGL
ncbi:hypothetical protein B0J13DRAFT_522259 [Dactylonectria estremocensis]|uniref:BZIP domain-containing protein n=1 Tax=Dactylonectria estremocensis TaxID=1079267 RepID=A0A9P9F4E3_9HYPO|nr:hypothetical protein B0J13DRAFT_522259 [Dactylonectria estremocensis]